MRSTCGSKRGAPVLNSHSSRGCAAQTGQTKSNIGRRLSIHSFYRSEDSNGWSNGHACLNCFTRTAGAESPWSLAKGNRIWNFLDSRAAEKARSCLNSASYCVNLLVQSPQKSEFPHREVGRCRKDPLSGLQSMCKESKCDCPGMAPELVGRVLDAVDLVGSRRVP